jgi:hypothetical protein
MAANTVRIPLAVDLTDRESASYGLYQTDTLLVNCYIEREDGRTYVVKRPGLTTAYTYNGGAPTNGQGTAYYNGMLYAIGSNVLYRLTGSANGSANGASWSASTAATFAGREGHATIVFNGSIFVLGGLCSFGVGSNDVWSSEDGIHWQQLTAAAPWAGRRDHACVVLGNTLYLMGGNSGTTNFNDVWSTQDGVNWTQVVGAANWSARYGMGVVAFNGGIMLLGGRGTVTLNDVWFSTDGATWTQLVQNATWASRSYFACLVYNNKVWVAGGLSSGGTVYQNVFSSSDGLTWTNTGNLPGTRFGMAACVYGNAMWFIGGQDSGAGINQNSTDGNSFNVATSIYGGGAVVFGSAVAFKTPTSVSAINAPTIWLIAGQIVGSDSSQVYRATLNVALPGSFSPATGASNSEQWQSVTQNAGQYLIWKNTVDAWVLHAGILEKITSPNYPTVTVPGVANLDDTVYVMGPDGTIYGSDLSTPFVWSANNYITADYQSDVGIAIASNQQYVVAFKSLSTQFFYDAGRYPGSPLLPVVSANQKIGCVAAGSIVNMDNTIVFMATSGAADRYIAMLNGTSIQKVSTPAIDRILYKWVPDAFCYAQNIKMNGHDFYVLTLKSSTVTLAYDFVEQRWHTMGTAVQANTYFTGINYVTDGTYGYVQDLLFGLIFKYDPSVYQDAGSTITVSATTSKFDGGTNNRKFCGSATVIGDRTTSTSPNNASLQWSDNDGQIWSTAQTVDLTSAYPRVNRLGSFHRRQFRLTHTSNNPMRVEAIELEVISE